MWDFHFGTRVHHYRLACVFTAHHRNRKLYGLPQSRNTCKCARKALHELTFSLKFSSFVAAKISQAGALNMVQIHEKTRSINTSSMAFIISQTQTTLQNEESNATFSLNLFLYQFP